MAHRRTLTLFDWLRRASALRMVLVVAAMLASQSSLACALENVIAGQGIEIVADEGASTAAEKSGTDCCALCVDCAHCGGCHGSAVTPRASTSHSFHSSSWEVVTAATAAPKLWAPPTLLRPPIDAS